MVLTVVSKKLFNISGSIIFHKLLLSKSTIKVFLTIMEMNGLIDIYPYIPMIPRVPI